jgi:hypothetical protein
MFVDLDRLEVFPWAGHSTLLGVAERPWQDADAVLARFAGTLGKARKGYGEFILAGTDQGHRDELSGGGLIRSAGGNPELLEAGRGRERWSSDERILGSSEFVERVWAETERQGLEKTRSNGGDVNDLIARAAAQFGLTPAELCGGTRRRPVVAARRCAAWVAVRHLGGSPTAVARALGVSRETIPQDNGIARTRRGRPQRRAPWMGRVTVLRGLEQRPEGVEEMLGGNR